MWRFLAGACVGAVIAAICLLFVLDRADDSGAGASTPAVARDAQGERDDRPDPVLLPPATPPRLAPPTGVASAQDAFPQGEAILRVGEGYVFGEESAVGRGDDRPVDVRCLEITGSRVVLRCTVGGCPADVPLGAVGIPGDAREAVELLTDAREELDPCRLVLSTRVRRDATGLGLVRSSSGETFRVAVVSVSAEPDALRRTARLIYKSVPTHPEGGVLAVPAVENLGDAVTLQDVNAWMAQDARLPHASFTNFLRGEYKLLRRPPEELVLTERSYLVLDEPLRTEIQFNAYSGLVAPHGIAPTGTVDIRSYTGVAVRGDMEGTIQVHSYAHLHLAGDLRGKVDVASYATLVIDGDLVGEVRVGSYTTLLLRGRLLGTLEIASSGSRFWFGSWMSRTEAEAIVGRGNELHLRESDLPAGTYTDWKGWGKVVVGEERWSTLVD